MQSKQFELLRTIIKVDDTTHPIITIRVGPHTRIRKPAKYSPTRRVYIPLQADPAQAIPPGSPEHCTQALVSSPLPTQYAWKGDGDTHAETTDHEACASRS